MAEFKEGSLWMKLSFIMGLLGFGVVMFTFPSGLSSATVRNSAEGCLAIAFMAYLVAVILVLCLVLLDEVKENKAAKICLIIFALVAGVAELIGVALLDYNFASSMPSLLGAFSAFLGLLCGIFAILDLVGVGAAK